MEKNLNLKNLIINEIKKAPLKPGVYFFKNNKDEILYIGKAKNLKNRISSYFKNDDFKSSAIVSSSSKIDFIETKNELEAMLLEAQLIQSNQPKFNVLLKTGQPFIYLMVTNSKLPELKIVRNKKQKGTYFGPFIEKSHARRVYNFLVRTFQLKICKNKIDQGCLYYHMGICSGSCRKDFDINKYLERLELAKQSLKHGHNNFLKYLQTEIEKHNKKLEFEKSKELNEYLSAFKSVFGSMQTDIAKNRLTDLTSKDIWILSQDKKSLFLFKEKETALKKQHVFYPPLPKYQTTLKFKDKWQQEDPPKLYAKAGFNPLEWFQSYYQTYSSPTTILINFEIEKEQKDLIEQFLQKWSVFVPQTAALRRDKATENEVKIIKPETGHFSNLIKLAQIKAEQEIKKEKTLSKSLQQFLKLSHEVHTIDCFDISHKQGKFMVGSCVRFKDGQPDKNSFRRFKIKTVVGQDDYACLREIVKRRYSCFAKASQDKPDLLLIDGGKGQLNAVKDLFPDVEFASLVKREETIFSDKLPNGKKLNLKTFVGQTLIALRDYTHHFAISYHKKLERL
ncbi:MAG: GIY-YIG nuclease family protein [bacterium]